MNYLYFLRERTRFIRRFYAGSASAFIEDKRKIEAGEAPFDGPPGYEDAEPPYLDEWTEAEDSINVVGQSCVSLLSSSLHLYVQEWISELTRRAGEEQLLDLGIGFPKDDDNGQAFKKGWINGYREYCAKMGVNWSSAPSDLTLLEEIVLARNSVQHATDISSIPARQLADRARTHPGFFADPIELAMFSRFEHVESLRPVRLSVTQEKLFAAIDEVERFCEWLDVQHPLRRSKSGAV